MTASGRKQPVTWMYTQRLLLTQSGRSATGASLTAAQKYHECFWI